jgi:hypothetical protein
MPRKLLVGVNWKKYKTPGLALTPYNPAGRTKPK